MLELRNVGYETDDNKEILHDVSLTVQERFVAITGPEDPEGAAVDSPSLAGGGDSAGSLR